MDWTDIPGWEGLYQASRAGQVRSLPRGNTRGRVLKGAVGRNGYPYVSLSRPGDGTRVKQYLVHRLIWLTFTGESPAVVMHRDDDPLNSRLDNLLGGEPVDNVRDMIRKGRRVKGQAIKTHCPSGHSYDAENTYWTKSGSRQCRECNRARYRKWYRKKRSQRV